MAKELAFVLINPHSIAKSRTGGIVARYISRTGLDLVGARMFAPSAELAKEYSELIRNDPNVVPAMRDRLADYVAREYAPAADGGRRRVMMLLFEGENAIQAVKDVTGAIRASENGESVRDTYGDYVLDAAGEVSYLEPAVFIGPTAASAGAALKLWAKYSEECGGMVDGAADVAKGDGVQKGLVILKPDNFRFASARPGLIIDIFSRSGLRIVCAKVHRMSVAEAEEFYGPVKAVLQQKLKGKVAERSARALSEELKMELGEDVTGRWGEGLVEAEKEKPGTVKVLLLVYAGPNAIERIRSILGPTDPSKAGPGSVRKEFGHDIMVNAAHASDSPENAEREMRITKVGAESICSWVEAYYP